MSDTPKIILVTPPKPRSYAEDLWFREGKPAWWIMDPDATVKILVEDEQDG